jgi:hypothetical protein
LIDMTPLEHLESLDPKIVGQRPDRLHVLVWAAITATRAALIDESVGDIVGPGGVNELDTDIERIRKLLAMAHKAVRQAAIPEPDSTFADPILIAAVRQFPAPAGTDVFDHAENMLASLRAIAAAPCLPDPKGGRPPSSDVDRNAVRAAMHYLDQQGMPRSGGWGYEDRKMNRKDRRSTNDELSAVGPAALLVEVGRIYGLRSDHAAIKGFHDAYVELLNVRDRGPDTADYVPRPLLEDFTD